MKMIPTALQIFNSGHINLQAITLANVDSVLCRHMAILYQPGYQPSYPSVVYPTSDWWYRELILGQEIQDFHILNMHFKSPFNTHGWLSVLQNIFCVRKR